MCAHVSARNFTGLDRAEKGLMKMAVQYFMVNEDGCTMFYDG